MKGCTKHLVSNILRVRSFVLSFVRYLMTLLIIPLHKAPLASYRQLQLRHLLHTPSGIFPSCFPSCPALSHSPVHLFRQYVASMRYTLCSSDDSSEHVGPLQLAPSLFGIRRRFLQRHSSKASLFFLSFFPNIHILRRCTTTLYSVVFFHQVLTAVLSLASLSNEGCGSLVLSKCGR